MPPTVAYWRGLLEYWGPKLDRNVERDAQNQAKLQEMGWDYMVIWECQTGDIEDLSRRIQGFLE